MGRRSWRVAAMAIATTALLGACTGTGGTTSGTTSGPEPESGGAQEAAPPTTANTTATEETTVIEVSLPILPPVALPDISQLGATGDVVSDRLGELVSPTSGVELVTAVTCADADGDGRGDLVYSGSTSDTDVFDIEADGSGAYRDERDDGLVSLQVDADGSGEYYDESRGELITITVAADGSGQYYSERRDGLVTVDVAGDGSGIYYDDRNDTLLTVTLPGDGTAEYYREAELDDGIDLLTIAAAADGSGEYYREIASGEVFTLRIEPGGGWVYSVTTNEQLTELTVAADGSGRYRQSGVRSIDITFAPDGSTEDGSYQLRLPPSPRFSVAAEFPDLGRLGSLSPPCAAVLRFDAEFLFDFGQAELRPGAADVLDDVVAALNEAGKPIEINGHTDSVGDEASNVELSVARAEVVEAALRTKGLTVETSVTGLGESQPIAPNETDSGVDDPAGRARNRRVEIVIPE